MFKDVSSRFTEVFGKVRSQPVCDSGYFRILSPEVRNLRVEAKMAEALKVSDQISKHSL